MATNMAQKRAKKAQRQKQLVAAKRKAEALEASLPARVLRAAQAPIQRCTIDLMASGAIVLIVVGIVCAARYIINL